MSIIELSLNEGGLLVDISYALFILQHVLCIPLNIKYRIIISYSAESYLYSIGHFSFAENYAESA